MDKETLPQRGQMDGRPHHPHQDHPAHPSGLLGQQTATPPEAGHGTGAVTLERSSLLCSTKNHFIEMGSPPLTIHPLERYNPVLPSLLTELYHHLQIRAPASPRKRSLHRSAGIPLPAPPPPARNHHQSLSLSMSPLCTFQYERDHGIRDLLSSPPFPRVRLSIPFRAVSIYSTVRTHHTLFTPLSLGTLLGFHLLTIMNNASRNNDAQVFMWTCAFVSLGCVLGWTAGSQLTRIIGGATSLSPTAAAPLPTLWQRQALRFLPCSPACDRRVRGGASLWV